MTEKEFQQKVWEAAKVIHAARIDQDGELELPADYESVIGAVRLVETIEWAQSERTGQLKRGPHISTWYKEALRYVVFGSGRLSSTKRTLLCTEEHDLGKSRWAHPKMPLPLEHKKRTPQELQEMKAAMLNLRPPVCHACATVWKRLVHEHFGQLEALLPIAPAKSEPSAELFEPAGEPNDTERDTTSDRNGHS